MVLLKNKMSLDTIKHFKNLGRILRNEGLDSMLFYDNSQTRLRNKSYNTLIGATITLPSNTHAVFSPSYSIFYNIFGQVNEINLK